jgi:hypothetical protein
MEPLSRSLKALARADRMVVTIWLRAAVKRGVVLALAALIAALGFAMLNAAGYLALEPRLGPVWAALAVAGCDFVIAAGLAFVASLMRPGRDLDLALELHDHAVEHVSGLAAHPFQLAGRALVGPLVALLLRLLARAASKPKDGGD